MLTDPTARYMSHYLKRANPEAWMMTACDISYDANEQLLFWMIRNRHCERAVALAIYWRLAPRWDAQYVDRNSIPRSSGRLTFDLLREIEARFLSGFYRSGTLGFNPSDDRFAVEMPSSPGYDWTSDYNDKPLARPIPEFMKLAIVGTAVSRSDPGFSSWIEGMPPDVWKKLESFHASRFWQTFHALLEVLRDSLARKFRGGTNAL